MISLDGSIIAAIALFILLIIALNQLLFKPLARVQAERENRTSGLIARMKEKMDHQSGLFNEYQATIKNSRMEGYRRQDELRAEAMKKRAEAMAQARQKAEQMIQDSRNSISSQVAAAKQQLALEAQEMARKISAPMIPQNKTRCWYCAGTLKKEKGGRIGELWTGTTWKKVVLVSASLLIYALVLTRLGFLIATFGLMALLYGILGRTRLWIRIIAALVTVLVAYAVFRVWLDVQLPKGLLG